MAQVKACPVVNLLFAYAKDEVLEDEPEPLLEPFAALES